MGGLLRAFRPQASAQTRQPGQRDAIVPDAPTQAIPANVPVRPQPEPKWGQLEEEERSPQSLNPHRYLPRPPLGERDTVPVDVGTANTINPGSGRGGG
jgi:hypothetical protein